MDPLNKAAALDAARDARKKAFSFAEEFKNFAFKGNVIDLAVGIIIGAAFTKIITALVDNIIMPLVSLALPSEQGFKEWKVGIGGKQILFGNFIAEVVNFVIVALVLFIFIVKFIGWIMRKKKEEVAALPPLTKEQELLTEIRDLLKAEKATSGGTP